MSKRVFNIQTTWNMNSQYHQANELNEWVRQQCFKIAQESCEIGKETGRQVQIIVEVLD